MYRETFGKKLKKAREDAGYTQMQVSNITGIAQAIISNLENGNREPSLENLCILIDFYEVPAYYILGTKK